jgi:hypothetical protein
MGDLRHGARHRVRHRASVALVGLLMVTGAVCIASNQAHAVVPPGDPGSNVPVQVPLNCDNFALDDTPGCLYSALVNINYGRSLEGVGPMILPADYPSLPPSEQLFVVFNLERTGRGLPAFSELDAGADNDALLGALGSSDPPIESSSNFQAGPGVAAFGIGNALVADWEWMYTDGCYPYRGSADCTSISPTDPGGWMHRNAILGNYGSEPAAGAAEATATSGSYPGLLTWTAEFGEAEGGVPNGDTVFLNSSVSYPSSAAPWIVRVNPSAGGPGSTLTIEGVYLYGASAVDFGSSGCWSHPTVESDESLGVVVPGCARSGSSVQVVVPPDTSNGLAFNPAGPVVSAAASSTFRTPFVGMAATPTGGGYWEVASDGGVFTFGGAGFDGSMGGHHLNAPIVGMAAAPDGHGYWLVGSDGGVFAFGSAGFHGGAGNLRLDRPIVGMAATPDGGGYWLVASDGGVFSYGDARFHGSMGGRPLHQPVVGMAADQATGGYWLVASDGGIFSFDAPFDGSTGNIRLDRPVVGMEAAPNGSGYRLVASDGGIFCFHLPFEGSEGAVRLGAPVVGMTAQGSTGYWMVAADGGIFSFGGAAFYGSQG